MKKSITFNGINADGKTQRLYGKLFDILDKIFSNEEKKSMIMSWKNCEIRNFRFSGKWLKVGTTRNEFRKYVMKNNKN